MKSQSFKPLQAITGLLLGTAVFFASCTGTKEEAVATFNVIPQPVEVAENPDATGFSFKSGVTINAPEELQNEAAFLKNYLSEAGIKVTDKQSGPAIELQASLQSENPEAYKIEVTPEKVTVNGASSAGTFYGIQTLRKALFTVPAENLAKLPEGTVTDAPRFGYRGAHFDVSRHFFTLDEVKKFIDMMAIHNLNTFHWHITDDQGWRIEIKKYPKLTEIGSHRDSTIIGHSSDKWDNVPVEGFYTQEQAREIVEYAAARHIKVIPEIDLPGHMRAALAAYPELGCSGGPYSVWSQWGVAEEVLCAGNDKTIEFITDVLNEIMDIFPSDMIHIGGDECPKTEWKKCPKCQARIKAEGIKANDRFSAEARLQGYITQKAAEVIAKRGRSMIGWDEILEGEIPQDAIIMSWRGIDGAVEGTAKGHRVILSPNTYFYFDYYQSRDLNNEPVCIGGYLPLETVYSFEPSAEGMDEEQAKLILGPQANLWTEYIKTYDHAEYMELPRMAALSEVGWTAKGEKDYDGFIQRLRSLMRLYETKGYNYARHFADVKATFTSDPDNKCLRLELEALPDSEILYTLDGSDPTAEAVESGTTLRYTEPVKIDHSARVKAVAITDGKPGRIISDTINVNKATFAKTTFNTQPAPNYTFNGPATLTDGLAGSDNFNTGRWIGFNSNDADIVIEFDKPTEISTVAFNTFHALNAWICDTPGYTIEGAAGNEPYKLLTSGKQADNTKLPEFGPVAHSATFAPVTVDRVRLKISRATLPEGHSGAGKPAFVFIDEVNIQ